MYDQGKQFTSKFRRTIMILLQIKLNLSVSVHQQPERQSQRMYRTLGELLRCYISYTQKD